MSEIHRADAWRFIGRACLGVIRRDEAGGALEHKPSLDEEEVAGAVYGDGMRGVNKKGTEAALHVYTHSPTGMKSHRRQLPEMVRIH